MEKYMEIQNDCQLYKDYFEWVGNWDAIKSLFHGIKEKYGIETTGFYTYKDRFQIAPTENDNKNFSSMLKRPPMESLRKTRRYPKNGFLA